ncbi:hypothetical protein FDX04_07870 [Citrobacter sp. wls615]|uniref:hypothetical protein n=1 Tax=Citrobacter sp. wls615 TaxID=2576435 RepID=UPI0010C93B7C|nr:hypothetical protein [Citrobacter sp. wls615]TKV15576.1 hypothetical protein FDX04_07870 [Citrobacter sp. wls615]
MTTNNHPAHGPISLERLHQISEILSKAAAQSDGGNLGYAMADAVKVIEGAIAAFGAEPVGYFYADKPGDWYQISDGDRVPSHRRIPPYPSPQSSPVVKLPNEFISSEGIVVQIEKLMAVLAVHGIQYERRGNACRAAMLQAGNSPIIGIDLASEPDRSVDVRYLAPPGYVMVPVEPTMEMLDEFDSIIDYGAEDSKDAWSRLIAAAPQQEVK